MDQTLFFLINRTWTHPALDRLMAAVSSLDLWMPFIIALILLTAWRGGARARWFLVCLGLTLAVSDGVVGQSLKRIVHRPRPFQTTADVRQIDLQRRAKPRLLALFRPLDVKVSPAPAAGGPDPGTGRSFPSSHTMNNFCAAVVLTWFYRRRGWWYFFAAGLVGYSRVYVGSHWPSDVFFSALLAVGLAFGMMALLRLGARWFAWKLGP
jgi:undecaprenyl-diphosphatase